MGAALDWLHHEYGEGYLEEVELAPNTAAAPALVVPGDPDSLSLTMVNMGVFDIFLTLIQNATAGTGIRLGANGGSVSITVRDDATLPTRAWYGASPGGASTLYTLRLTKHVQGDQDHPGS